MAPADRAATILLTQEAIAKASADLDQAVAAADVKADANPEYRRLAGQATAARDRSSGNHGTREEKQAAIAAADKAQQLCDTSRRALVLGDKDVVVANNSLTLQKIKMWSLTAIDLFDGLQKPEDFTKAGSWTFKGDTLVASGLHEASGIVFPADLPKRYLLRVDVGPCDMQWLQIMVPVGTEVSTVRFGPLSFKHLRTIAVFVDASSRESPVLANGDPEVLAQQFPTLLGEPDRHKSGIAVSSATVPFYSILAIPCKDVDEADEILEEPVFLGAAWQPKDYDLVRPSDPLPGSHSMVPYREPPPEYHPQIPVGNLGPVRR